MHRENFENYYQILGLPDFASIEEVKKAFRKLAKKYHPDKGGDPEKFKKILEAYRILSNPDKKSEYDATLSFYLRLGDGPYNETTEEKPKENFVYHSKNQENMVKIDNSLEKFLYFLINTTPFILNTIKELFNLIFSPIISKIILSLAFFCCGLFMFFGFIFLPAIVFEILDDHSLSLVEKILRIIFNLTIILFLIDITVIVSKNSKFYEDEKFRIPLRNLDSFKKDYKDFMPGLIMFIIVCSLLGYFFVLPLYMGPRINKVPNFDFQERQKNTLEYIIQKKENFKTEKKLFILGDNSKEIILDTETPLYCSPRSFITKPFYPAPNTKAIILYQIKNPAGTWFRVAIDKKPIIENNVNFYQFYYGNCTFEPIREEIGFKYWIKEKSIPYNIRSQILDIEQFSKNSIGTQSFYVDRYYIKEKIRKCPYWECEIEWMVGEGGIATVIERKGDWFRVVVSNFDTTQVDQFGEEGWVYKDFIPTNIRNNFE